ncbi:Bug family tripartite tricarboxylate transporter substrate binding protein [Humitalea sp. 24SJ18S-53]|uniref:Bug family tripartite tricarboxylate transporter substrate binding protein n=1 Tax=Humitalea sp. 24SJ18S-53 TaxID=3422307 RepID=UPI003D6647EE
MTAITRRGLLAASLLPTIAQAQPQQAGPLRLIVGFAPGGTADVVARLAAAEMGRTLGRTVVVENRSGASGNLATLALLQQPADGTTMAMAGLQLVTNPGLIGQLGYDPRTDLEMVGQLTALPVVVMASARSGITTMAEAIARAGAGDGIRIATAGLGTSSYLGAELMFRALGGRFEAVQYRGGAPAFQALMTGDVEMMFDLVAAYQAPAAAEGRIRMLGVMQAARTPGLPDVPSFGELGLPPAAMMRSWQGICVRASTPPVVVAALHAATRVAVQAPEFQQRMANLAIEATASPDPAAFQKFYMAELQRWTGLIHDAGIRAQ